MAKGIKRQLKIALHNAYVDARLVGRRSRIAGALASEGYSGGYIQGINDVISALNGVHPNSRFWKFDQSGTQIKERSFNDEDNKT